MSPHLGLALPTPASPLELAELVAREEDRSNAQTLPPPEVDLDDPFDGDFGSVSVSLR